MDLPEHLPCDGTRLGPEHIKQRGPSAHMLNMVVDMVDEANQVFQLEIKD